MSSRHHHRLLWCLLLVSSAAAARAATPVIGAQLFQETNDRIEDLYGKRNAPPKPLTSQDNPFRPLDDPLAAATVSAPAVVAPAAPEIAKVSESSDEALLRQAYTGLTFGGVLQVGGRTVVVINKTNYREGGLLTIHLQGASIYLRIIALTPDSITLGLNEARLTLHF
jgi:hypothetical protein